MKPKLIRTLLMVGLSAGTTLYSGNCASQNLWRFNPCGTILSTNVCQPTDWYTFLFNGPDFNIDPTCSVPFQCGAGGSIP